MPPAIEIKGNGPELTAKLPGALRDFSQFSADAYRLGVVSTAVKLKKEMRKESSQGPLFQRSKRLLNSWSDNVGGTRLGDITGVVGSFVFYSAQHKDGGTFRPNKALWFWIPLGPNVDSKRRAKVSIAKAQNLIKAKKWRFTSRANTSDDVAAFGKTAAVLNENNEIVYILIREKTLKKSLFLFEQGDRLDLQLFDLVADFDKYFATNP